MAVAETSPEADTEAEAKKPSKLPLVLGLVACLALGGGGFFAAYSGMLDGLIGGEDAATTAADGPAQTEGDGAQDAGASSAQDSRAAFVELEPLIISLGTGPGMTHLRFRAYLEVADGADASVTALMPRILDVLNGYLRALKPEELADPTMLIRLRAQMLRRVQLVIGEDLVKDLLVAEFVLN